MMGPSDIDGANIPTELALQHGKNIKADTALVEWQGWFSPNACK